MRTHGPLVRLAVNPSFSNLEIATTQITTETANAAPDVRNDSKERKENKGKGYQWY
ncbi:hypothetical protein PHLCEN_2v6195 [Hermanssonia centrifuga]|uniref:Uncharacterized protein n=1 Tax=Hermanssonia centrifuga TaxID=98765 RepID=A0A2R6P069_9APHY|nr:hypothetical protein PHLCEN_2v6195 [Hermanssonia centrifuga]